MFSKIWGGIMVIAVFTGFLTGRASEVAAAATFGAASGVEFCLSLLAIMAFWGGIMSIAEQSGIIYILEKLLSPVFSRMFKTASKAARQSVTKNIAANVLGLGNAATPFGIKAISKMKQGDTATNEMVRFMVLNTASIQLLPTTLISMRAAAGSALPESIIVPVWITSAAALTVGILFSKIGEKIWK